MSERVPKELGQAQRIAAARRRWLSIHVADDDEATFGFESSGGLLSNEDASRCSRPL